VDPTELPHLIELQRLIADGGPQLQAHVLCEASVGERRFPVHALTLGNPSPDVPAVDFSAACTGSSASAPKW